MELERFLAMIAPPGREAGLALLDPEVFSLAQGPRLESAPLPSDFRPLASLFGTSISRPDGPPARLYRTRLGSFQYGLFPGGAGSLPGP